MTAASAAAANAQADATQALADAATAQGTAEGAVAAALNAQSTADGAVYAASETGLGTIIGSIDPQTTIVDADVIATRINVTGMLSKISWGNIKAALNSIYATLASPTFTGSPSLPTAATAVTQPPGESSTRIATTEFATSALNLKANLSGCTFTGAISATNIGTVASQNSNAVNITGGTITGLTNLTTTELDVNGTLNVAGNTTLVGTTVATGKVTANGQGSLSALGDNDVITSSMVKTNLMFEGLRYIPYSPAANSSGGGFYAGNHGFINVDAGATTSRRMYLAPYVFGFGGSIMRFDYNFRLQVTGTFYISSSSVECRVYFGTDGAFTLPYAGQSSYPIKTRGFGFKVRRDPNTNTAASEKLQVALFARDGTAAADGTYIESAWTSFGAAYYTLYRQQSFVLEKIGTTISLYGADSIDQPSGLRRARVSATPIVSIGGVGVPNDGAWTLINYSSVEAVIIGDGVNANVANNQKLFLRNGNIEIF